MLQTAGYINILIGIAHLIGLFWAEKMYEITGIKKEMAELSQINSSLPYLLTIFVGIVFFVFGFYGLSADSKFRELPLLKPMIFVIAGVYLARGLVELIIDNIHRANSASETIYSLFALTVGLLFLIGTKMF